ncbi:hypothetical protein RRG08_060458 [Elysia crispata]|uniref:Uncharacterized protein n=1 Tax=Elysia crispata TaxID=231223 RepID=A0AAE1E7D9_9GAST|nr:hypothetical protein RRG08_060458 [Elysia crispata]
MSINVPVQFSPNIYTTYPPNSHPMSINVPVQFSPNIYTTYPSNSHPMSINVSVQFSPNVYKLARKIAHTHGKCWSEGIKEGNPGSKSRDVLSGRSATLGADADTIMFWCVGYSSPPGKLGCGKSETSSSFCGNELRVTLR